MKRIFLSAGVPVLPVLPAPRRRDFFDGANPYLIQFAVRELLTVCLGRRLIVWGGHPAITPMVWAVCEDLGVDYARALLLYQSRLFEDQFPQENAHFANVIYVDAVQNNRELSLLKMRTEMLSGAFEAAVFIGGMEGVLEEYQLFRQLHPAAKVLALSAPGGAAQKIDQSEPGMDFARMFYQKLGVAPNESRAQLNDVTQAMNLKA